ncbi:unnamed protein product [Adineta steineri]|uniref:Death domain-containing protein n=1 Tax=Adineta steineri TaxID=433720 RepID=A0A815QTF9_9BILA|nr:unnamed protein product [Adineta steineri]
MNIYSSFKQIYDYVEKSLDEYSRLINDLEIDYYQCSPTSIEFTSRKPRPFSVTILQAWSQPLNELHKTYLSHDIRNIETTCELLEAAKTGVFHRFIKDESIILMERISQKIVQQLNSNILILTDKIVDCMNLMKQYFLSFYHIKNIQYIIQNRQKEELPDEHLETAYTYEKSRWLHMFQVNKSVKVIREMLERIHTTEGVTFSTLSKECQELAIRCDCTSFPYIFVLPECYYEARQALNSLRTWLHDDRNYTEFIQKSLELLDRKYLEVKKTLEISKTQLSQIKYRTQTYGIQLIKFEQENEINKNKYKEFQTSFHLKENEYTSKYLKYDLYVKELNKLYQQSNDIQNNILMKTFQNDIKHISNELPKLKLQVDLIQTGMNSFQERERKLIEMQNKHKNMEKDIQLALENKIHQENNLNRIEKCRDIIRNIYKCRKKNNLIQKIFYDLPIASNDNDDLSKALCIVSKCIGRDWNLLYWNLPFYPKRGQEELYNDIKYINEKYYRGDVFQDQAIEILNKWRRYHTRAKIDDLIHGLQQIHRLDIIKLIEEDIIKPKLLLNVCHEEIDPRKKEIEDLNQKLIRLFDKIRNNTTNLEEI